MTQRTDVVVIGGGQAGLAAGYHLRRLGIDHVILDAWTAPGGAWQHTWNSLCLFSPAQHSSLPGRLMPVQEGELYPDAAHVVAYLADYEKRYELPVQRGVWVDAVRRDGTHRQVDSDAGDWRARAVIGATGTWTRPFIPAVPGRREFAGRQLHMVQYRSPSEFAGQRVIVVGGGNSGAQIAADLAHAGAGLTWVTRRRPRYLADDIDGRALFDAATARRRALDEGRADWRCPPEAAAKRQVALCHQSDARSGVLGRGSGTGAVRLAVKSAWACSTASGYASRLVCSVRAR
ncbi:NAD(P)-binding domain-containing protein [Streptomyces sp. NPDC048507]|uniref:NAD(P)-binding domain-containing protein n=1 Tax=Streptomyces sp. NPDC048507 TaxID=3365560 RepID=UPI00371C2D13